MTMKYKQTFVIAAIFSMTMVLLGMINHGEKIVPNRDFATFPMDINGWHGDKTHFAPEIYDVLGVDDSILANYRNAEGELVQLYVGFYQSQKEGDLIHSPKNCLPGAGWNITETTLEAVDVAAGGSTRTLNAIRLILRNGKQKQVVLYWFQSRGRIISSEYMQKIWLVIDSITKGRTDGSFVRLIAPVSSDEARTLKMLKSFAQDVYPHLADYIPS